MPEDDWERFEVADGDKLDNFVTVVTLNVTAGEMRRLHALFMKAKAAKRG